MHGKDARFGSLGKREIDSTSKGNRKGKSIDFNVTQQVRLRSLYGWSMLTKERTTTWVRRIHNLRSKWLGNALGIIANRGTSYQ